MGPKNLSSTRICSKEMSPLPAAKLSSLDYLEECFKLELLKYFFKYVFTKIWEELCPCPDSNPTDYC